MSLEYNWKFHSHKIDLDLIPQKDENLSIRHIIEKNIVPRIKYEIYLLQRKKEIDDKYFDVM